MSPHESSPVNLSVVVPAWNEEQNLSSCLETMLRTFSGQPHEIIVVDDGSSDGTLALAERFAADCPGRIHVLSLPSTQGIGAALRAGFAAARGSYVTICPADFEMTSEDWAPFAAALGQGDVLVGCRAKREGYNPLMRINAWIYPRLVAALFGLRLRDVNWICVYRRDLLQQVEITQAGIPMLAEILVKLRDLGATFREVDCRMQPRASGIPSASRVTVMWKTLKGLLRMRRNYRRPVIRHSSIR